MQLPGFVEPGMNDGYSTNEAFEFMMTFDVDVLQPENPSRLTSSK